MSEPLDCQGSPCVAFLSGTAGSSLHQQALNPAPVAAGSVTLNRLLYLSGSKVGAVTGPPRKSVPSEAAVATRPSAQPWAPQGPAKSSPCVGL